MLKIGLCFFFVLGVCIGSPVQLREDGKDAVDAQEVLDTARNCIPTRWGCIDPSDPSIRPRVSEDASAQENNEEILKGPQKLGCIPTIWGCIDPSDPGIRPRPSVDEELSKTKCRCIDTSFGCIDPCDPGFHPVDDNAEADK